jgi:dolichol-phosphate mannosyltransferase
MRVIIIIPTYNERGNVVRLISAIEQQVATLPHDFQILVVDDNSPDGTAETVRQLQTEHPGVHLITGQKAGLGAAYIRGMRYSIDQLGAEAVFEMDADFSHKPEDVPRLMAAIGGGADFVIGSRYVRGGSIPNEWTLFRRMNSMFGNMVARYVAGIYCVHDCTAGFRAIRAALLRQIDFDALRVQGYAFQVALLYEAVLRRANIVEVPVEFIERTEGQSKLGIDDIVEFIVNAWWIRFRSSRTFIKFAIVGTSGVLVNLGSFGILLHLGLSKWIASPVAIEISILSNFLFNNFWTFRWQQTRDSIGLKGLKFNVVSVASLAVSYSTFIALSLFFPSVLPQIHQLLGTIPAIAVNYFLNSYWTFRNQPNQ